tara:strand:+ start:142 stop:372 length:231 start_codon:yes stop_codon:yes gene_type:complete
MKKITLNVEGITQKQWSNFVLELNIMKKQWRPYGVDVKLIGHGLKKIIDVGNKKNDYTKQNRRNSKTLERDEESEV